MAHIFISLCTTYPSLSTLTASKINRLVTYLPLLLIYTMHLFYYMFFSLCSFSRYQINLTYGPLSHTSPTNSLLRCVINGNTHRDHQFHMQTHYFLLLLHAFVLLNISKLLKIMFLFYYYHYYYFNLCLYLINRPNGSLGSGRDKKKK